MSLMAAPPFAAIKPMLFGKQRQSSFTRFVEKSLGLKLFGEFLEPKEFCALARELHEVNVDLIFARGWVNAAAAMDHDFVSILWTEA